LQNELSPIGGFIRGFKISPLGRNDIKGDRRGIKGSRSDIESSSFKVLLCNEVNGFQRVGVGAEMGEEVVFLQQIRSVLHVRSVHALKTAEVSLKCASDVLKVIHQRGGFIIRFGIFVFSAGKPVA